MKTITRMGRATKYRRYTLMNDKNKYYEQFSMVSQYPPQVEFTSFIQHACLWTKLKHLREWMTKYAKSLEGFDVRIIRIDESQFTTTNYEVTDV